MTTLTEVDDALVAAAGRVAAPSRSPSRVT